MRPLLLPLLALLIGAGATHAEEPASLLPNSGFETGADGKPAGWNLATGVSWETDDNRFVRIRADEAGRMVMLFQTVPVQGIKALQLSYQVRYAGVKHGKEDWNDARILLNFKDGQGQPVKGGPESPRYAGTSTLWCSETLRFRVPDGAATLEIIPCMLEAVAGSMDLDDLRLAAVDPATLPVIATNVRGEPTPPVDAGGKPPGQLAVSGNQILDPAGTPVWLQGVNVPSLEWSNEGERIIPSIACATEVWKSNIIRLGVQSFRWFGRERSQQDGGADYRRRVDEAVLACASRGAYVIVDLHRYAAATAEDAEFWKDAAAHFKDQPAVLFGLLNEPYDLTWEQWRNGGPMPAAKRQKDDATKVKAMDADFVGVGMQGLVAAVRGTGAKNVIVAGGLDWAYDLSGMLNGFALDDLGGHGIIYDSHCYWWKTDWKGKFVDVSDRYPVILGEVGAHFENFDWLPKDCKFEEGYTWVPDMLALIQRKRIHWTAWSFHPGASPCLLMDWKDGSFTPTPWWGAFARAALSGARFTSEKMR